MIVASAFALATVIKQGENMKRYFVCIFTVTVLLCSGCTVTDYSIIDNTDNITVVEMNELGPSKIQTVDVSLVSFDINKTADILFADRTIVERSNAANSYIIQADDETQLTYFSTPTLAKLYYGTEYANCIFSIIQLESNAISDIFELPLTNSNFEFASSKQAETEVLQLLQKLGIDNIGHTKIYSLDQKNLASISKNQSADGKVLKKESEFLDCYLLQMKCIIQGIPLCEIDSVLPNGETLFGSKIYALFTQNGIEGLEITNLYIPNKVESLYNVISAQDAANVAYKRLSSIITKNLYAITNADLRYAPEFKDKSHASLRLVPVWLICIEEKNINYAINNKFYILINALTGEEFF